MLAIQRDPASGGNIYELALVLDDFGLHCRQGEEPVASLFVSKPSFGKPVEAALRPNLDTWMERVVRIWRQVMLHITQKQRMLIGYTPDQ